jgi:anaerobic dimethyl sulfoxide reductase subunit B (iron-sulfur subunit)
MARQYGFIIDSERCVDCRACVTACKTGHNIELGIAWRHVTSAWNGAYPQVTFTSQSMACNHCAEPACLKVCPVNAISKRREDGIVVVDRTRCIGCRACGDACPYHAPQYGKDGLMQKCDLCLDRVSTGKHPACVSTCPAGALAFGAMDELPGLAGKKMVRQLEGKTGPSVFVPVSGT